MSPNAIPGPELSRRDLLRTGLAGTALGVSGLAAPGLATAKAPAGVSGAESEVGEIYELQAAFHRAKTTQDIDLMMSLWATDATLVNQGDPSSPYTGPERLRPFWLGSGSFTHRRFSLVPSFKTQINVRRDHASLYFECHDIGDYDLATRYLASDTFLGGFVREIHGRWVFWKMTAGKSSPLSVDHDYLPGQRSSRAVVAQPVA
jgi:hypothetical protein